MVSELHLTSSHMVRCVRREELTSMSASPDIGVSSIASAELRLVGSERLEDLLAFDVPPQVKPAEVAEQVEASAYAFRLFSRSMQHPRGDPRTDDPPTVDIRSPSPQGDSPGFVLSRRPESYYLWDDTSPHRRRHFEEMALTGAEVLKRAKQPWPGCALPWRVLTGVAGVPKLQLMSGAASSRPSAPHRPRPGKKRRIMLRKKDAVAKQQQEKQAALLMDKALLLKDKKARKNRAQKLRRRAKKKTETTAES